MFYTLKGGRLLPMEAGSANESDEQHVGVIGSAEVFATGDSLGLEESSSVFSSRALRFEYQPGYDLLCVCPSPSIERPADENHAIYIYARESLLLFIADDPTFTEQQINSLCGVKTGMSLGGVLCGFLELLIPGEDAEDELLRGMVEEVSGEFLDGAAKESFDKCVLLKGQLGQLRAYYEKLLLLLSAMTGNRNKVLDESALDFLCRFTHKVQRMAGVEKGCREQLAALEESFKTRTVWRISGFLKLLTVMAAVSLPFILLAAWYGMNLPMPEKSYGFFYPIIALIGAGASAGAIFFLRRKNWF